MTDPKSAAAALQSVSPSVQLNLNVRGLGLSATLAINERSAQLQAEGRTIARLGLGQSPFPVPDVMQRRLRDHVHEKDYLAVQGLPALRQAICGYLKRTQDLDFDPEDILVGPGTKELMFLLQMVYYGDLVIPTPSWVSYAPQAQILGRPITWLPTDPETGLGVTAGALRDVCAQDPERPRLLILNSPGNPTGTAYTPEALGEIAAAALEHRMLLLSDEIYGGVQFDGRHRSTACFYRGGTIISDGISKWAGAGGWRLGFFAFPKALAWLRRGMAAAASETYTSVSAPIQHAAIAAFEGGPEIELYLERSRAILAALADHVSQRLTRAGALVNPIRGGFYAFPNFDPLRERLAARGITDSETLCERLLEEAGAATLPGSAFGRPAHELSLRLAFVDFDGAAALDALAAGETLDAGFLNRHARRVVEGIEAMARWAEA
ncbi:aminotransferase class I/II-fold pyridoxal phosphate-dependent enzyme [Alkalicaulis satelles]|uniref:aspartate transaminase n=1 Tax=Alkalicaulis satelles TaxID=2609175 RepID=A0A5M6Z9M1_9PROT|nr:aminotransferase class I/II-fold pyridoxal phosphate-dependent enzyme [Alkalicaulis satelles]KAA5801035.1 aminotransferase class I/II-fold pyridoxal phosphate-dependent enzyme [Alkalicaulis satelles]